VEPTLRFVAAILKLEFPQETYKFSFKVKDSSLRLLSVGAHHQFFSLASKADNAWMLGPNCAEGLVELRGVWPGVVFWSCAVAVKAATVVSWKV
jgi:hypothetical protein